ncbi:hypothetical protein J2X01_000293 [Arthrobacter ginsengisoli]|uniref:Uncharacterized protein n=1 Tax=Arthrobacter ginsengisoli TaxID=1356565 RepID=A0ABU1U759_9MICC|nr:hypothetical protein [Arthrobacter ginsengisoli]
MAVHIEEVRAEIIPITERQDAGSGDALRQSVEQRCLEVLARADRLGLRVSARGYDD